MDGGDEDYNPIVPPSIPTHPVAEKYKIRNIIGFWLLGMTNNYGYVVMLSAAHDILSQNEGTNGTDIFSTTESPTTESSLSFNWNVTTDNNTKRHIKCNEQGTGIILLADILPSMTVKFLSPFFLQLLPYWLKVSATATLALSGLLLVAFSKTVGISLLGVAMASASSGLGEVTFLSLTAFFDRSVVSAWSSGTGGAGVLGALSYAGLTTFLKPSTTLVILSVIPLLLFLSYFVVVKRPLEMLRSSEPQDRYNESTPIIENSQEDALQEVPDASTKVQILKGLAPLMVSLAVVYIFEYTINQAFFELAYFEHAFISPAEQYRWYQVDYQVGVFVSRSSVSLFHFRHIWITSVLQGINVGIVLVQILYPFIPSLWIMLVLVFYEGLLGGLAYVNTFYRIIKESEPRYREFSMSLGALADTIGITIAGFSSVPIHNAICRMFS